MIKKVTADLADPANPRIEFLTNPATFLAGEPSVSSDGRFIATAAQPNSGKKYDQQNNTIWILDPATGGLRQFDKLEGRAIFAG